jgi:hypothetical protein
VLHRRSEADFRVEDIGSLTGRVDVPGWLAAVQRRFAFLRDMDDDERRWCECNPRDDYEVTETLATIANRSTGTITDG